MTDEIIYPSTPFPLRPSLILLGRRGSEAHGLWLGDRSHNGIDDRDWDNPVDGYAPYKISTEEIMRLLNEKLSERPWQVYDPSDVGQSNVVLAYDNGSC